MIRSWYGDLQDQDSRSLAMTRDARSSLLFGHRFMIFFWTGTSGSSGGLGGTSQSCRAQDGTCRILFLIALGLTKLL